MKAELVFQKRQLASFSNLNLQVRVNNMSQLFRSCLTTKQDVSFTNNNQRTPFTGSGHVYCESYLEHRNWSEKCSCWML